MKTKDIPAIVMLSAGGVYCLLGILYQIPFLNFSIQLLSVLLIFWIIGGIIRMVFDRNFGEIEGTSEEEMEDEETEEKDADGETQESDESMEDEEESDEEE